MDVPDFPIACDLTALSEKEKKRVFELATRLFRRMDTVAKLDSGYELSILLPSQGDVAELAEFVWLDARCCPFMRHRLTLEVGGRLTLELSGKVGVREYLVGELQPLLSPRLAALLAGGG